MLYLKLFTELGDHRIVEICTIVCNDSLWDTVLTNEIMFDESGHIILGNGGERSCLNPFCKIVNSH